MATDLSRAEYRKSSRSASGENCVEVAGNLQGVVAIRDSKDPAGPALVFPREAWAAFAADAKRGGSEL